MSPAVLRIFALCAPIALGTACNAQPRLETPDAEETEGEPDDDGDPTPPPDDDAPSEDPGDRLDVPAQTTGEIGEENCAQLSETSTLSKRPAEILFVVDNSPSMVEESTAVQERLNSFSEQIVDAGIDMRVFLLTSYPIPGVPPHLDTGICIDPPLGGGGCPSEDSNLPLFWHRQANIGSGQPLSRLLLAHEHWEPMMREDSVKHVIVVTDDDEYYGAEHFHDEFTALDPSYEGYFLHGIVSLGCAQAAAVGEVYVDLAEQTGGVVADLCGQNFSPVFDTLSTAVIDGAGLSCTWALPEPPAGRVIDPETVTIELSNAQGQDVAIDRTAGPQGCGEGLLGWYFDDEEAPTTIVACEQTCETLRELEAASLSIDVGCAIPGEG